MFAGKKTGKSTLIFVVQVHAAYNELEKLMERGELLVQHRREFSIDYSKMSLENTSEEMNRLLKLLQKSHVVAIIDADGNNLAILMDKSWLSYNGTDEEFEFWLVKLLPISILANTQSSRKQKITCEDVLYVTAQDITVTLPSCLQTTNGALSQRFKDTTVKNLLHNSLIIARNTRGELVPKHKHVPLQSDLVSVAFIDSGIKAAVVSMSSLQNPKLELSRLLTLSPHSHSKSTRYFMQNLIHAEDSSTEWLLSTLATLLTINGSKSKGIDNNN